MVPFVLPSVLAIAEEATPKDFVNHILPSIKPVMKITDPIQVSGQSENLWILQFLREINTVFSGITDIYAKNGNVIIQDTSSWCEVRRTTNDL